MDEILKLQFLTDLNYYRIVLDIVLLFACSKLIEFTYKKYTYSNDNKLLFTNHMFNFLMAIFLIVTVIKSSIALSLGLVGALSIIRFRTAIKEPGQLINLLILTALAISMAAEKEALGILVAILYFINSFFNKKRNNSENEFSNPSLLRASIKNENLNIDEILNYENLIRFYKDANEIVHIEIEISSNKDKLNSTISNLKSNFTLITYEVL
jgi:hypothetical protein